jgi:hypothetical protein
MRLLIAALALVLAWPAVAGAQSTPAAGDRLTARQRIDWVVQGNLGANSLAAGVVVSAWQTAFDTPSEWDGGWGGFAQRYGQREVHIAISNGIEAGLGAAWNEDPRYARAATGSIGSRTAHALAAAFIARRGDHTAPAWARYAGVTGVVAIENSWLPPSVTTGPMTTWRIGSAFIGRAVGNAWAEFWPDVRQRLGR